MLDSNTTFIETLICEWYGIRCGSMNGHQKDICFKRDWTMCLKHDNHSKFDNQHDGKEREGKPI